MTHGDGSVHGQGFAGKDLLHRRRFLQGLAASGICLPAIGLNEVFGKDVSRCKDPRLVTGELKSWKSEPKLRRFEAAFRFLERSDIKDLPVGRQEIDGDALYALVMKLPTRSVETAQFEDHRRFIDVHYIISGQDTTGFAPTEELNVVEPYQEKTDIQMFSVPKSYTKLKMYPGRYAVFFPGGGHMPNCHLDRPHSLHKIVVKVARDYGIK